MNKEIAAQIVNDWCNNYSLDPKLARTRSNLEDLIVGALDVKNAMIEQLHSDVKQIREHLFKAHERIGRQSDQLSRNAEKHKSVLQDWVTTLGLRHQGVLLTAVRGCDTAPKHDASKLLSRCYRSTILNCHCGDAAKAATFIEKVDDMVLIDRMKAFRKNLDHYPHHYVMHVIHAAEIVGYKYPEPSGMLWLNFYRDMCRGLHVNTESEVEMDDRLNAEENEFANRDKQ